MTLSSLSTSHEHLKEARASEVLKAVVILATDDSFSQDSRMTNPKNIMLRSLRSLCKTMYCMVPMSCTERCNHNTVDILSCYIATNEGPSDERVATGLKTTAIGSWSLCHFFLWLQGSNSLNHSLSSRCFTRFHLSHPKTMTWICLNTIPSLPVSARLAMCQGKWNDLSHKIENETIQNQLTTQTQHHKNTIESRY
jgi:hypothetical protein